MPYDIYGQPLRAGHCEVHPDHRGEYPCERCLEDYYEYESGRLQQEEYERYSEEEYYTSLFEDGDLGAGLYIGLMDIGIPLVNAWVSEFDKGRRSLVVLEY